MDYQAAIDDYTKVIELNPQNTAAYYNRGLAFIDKKTMAWLLPILRS